MASGRIYILSNPCIPNLVKIGKTAASPELRAKQLSQFSGVPTPFRIVDSHFTMNIHSSEARIFERFGTIAGITQESSFTFTLLMPVRSFGRCFWKQRSRNLNM